MGILFFALSMLSFLIVAFLIMITVSVLKIEKNVIETVDETELRVSKLYNKKG